MCRDCTGDCAHTGDNDRLEWRETDLWPTPEDLRKGGGAVRQPPLGRDGGERREDR